MIKSYDFAIKIIRLYKIMTQNQKEYVLSKQLLRSGTAIGALVRESEHAQSKADFLHKINIALKEANETEYWLQLLHNTDYIDDITASDYLSNVSEILRMLAAIVKTTKTNIGRIQ
ncbi:MAG: four helix bundle protein [Saprospiraceae bacterium]|nr:four helix bundle protein [Saprospiraceae bacterium]